jgi:hypothetical protein
MGSDKAREDEIILRQIKYDGVISITSCHFLFTKLFLRNLAKADDNLLNVLAINAIIPRYYHPTEIFDKPFICLHLM